MKKFLALFLAVTLLLGTLLITPVFAEGEPESYAKDTVIQATVLMPETDAFTAIEGKLTYDSTTLEYCAGTFEAPNVSGMVSGNKSVGKISFNTSNINNSYDISDDHVLFKAQFKVLADNTVPAITSDVEDIYILNGIQFIDVSKNSVVKISAVSAPSTDDTTATESTQPSESQSTQASESQSTQASESQSTPATESQDTQATESTTADEGYPVTFVTDGHATINVYHTRNYATSAVDENVTTAVSRNRDTGEPDSIDEDAQINFLVVLENGYEIDSVTAEPTTNYKNLKGSDETLVENMYRITKVAGELTITVTTKLSETQDTTATESSETTATESSETTATESSETTATQSSETTATESSETQATTPTQAPVTTIKVSAAKKTIYVNASTTVKATVTNPLGTTKFKSSNTKVATVNASGKVTGKKAGSVTITATNNGKSATVKIKIVKRANPMTVKAKTIKASSKKTQSFAKAKAFTVKNAKGTVSFKKSKGNKKISVSSKGKVTVKKGLKKGTYKVTVKVTAKGNTAYKAKTKKVTLKVVVK